MAQLKKQLEINDFSGGFNTEQSPFRADPSTTLEEQNMILASDGSRARRYGYNTKTALPVTIAENERFFPPIAQFNDVSVDAGGSANEYKDFTLLYNYSPEPTPSQTYIALQNSATSAYDGTSISLGSVSILSDFSYRYARIGSQVLIPSSSQVLSITPDSASKLSKETASLYVRDLWGLTDGLETTERPVTLTENHAYNLLNQGWTGTTILKFFNEVGKYPSNADLPYFGLVVDTNSAANPPPVVYSTEVLKEFPAKDGAPKGKMRLAMDSPDSSRRNSYVLVEFGVLNFLGGLALAFNSIGGTSEQSSWIINSATSYMGRAFYVGNIEGQDFYGDGTTKAAGSLTPSFNNALVFSKIVTTPEPHTTVVGFADSEPDLDNPYLCHSKLDPTNETFTPTTSDGGIIFIAGADKLLGTIATRNSLLIVATNGIWELQANDGISPSAFTLFKVLDVSVYSMEGFVSVKDTVLAPTSTGIYALTYDGNARRSVPQSITDKSIRRFYLQKNKWIVDSVFDEGKDEVRWLLTTPPVYTDGLTLETVEQEELILDLRLGSFYRNKFADTQAVAKKKMYSFAPFERVHWARPLDADMFDGYRFVCRYVRIKTPTTIGIAETAIDTKRMTVQVQLLVAETGVSAPTTVWNLYSPTAGDFTDFGNTEQEAYIVTNPMTLGDTMHDKFLGKVVTHFYRTEDGFEDDGSGDWIPTNQSGCLMSARFDFSDSANSGKWTTPRQAYRLLRDYLPEDINDPFDYGHYIITTKSDIPGQGSSISLKFESESGKDLQLIGWATLIQVNGSM